MARFFSSTLAPFDVALRADQLRASPLWLGAASSLVGVACIVSLAGCSTPSAPEVRVSYAQSPVVEAALSTPSPVPSKRITRLPVRPAAAVPSQAPPEVAEVVSSTPSDNRLVSGQGPAVSAPVPAPGAPAPAAAVAAVAVVVNVGQPTETAAGPEVVVQTGSVPGITAVAGASASEVYTASSATPDADHVSQSFVPSPASTLASQALSPSATAFATPVATETPSMASPEADSTPTASAIPGTAPTAGAVVSTQTPAAIAGAVPSDQGLFVTSDSKTARYYYARDDNGWHRIHADHQVWFRTVDDLLRAFPNRALHAAATRRPTRTPTP